MSYTDHYGKLILARRDGEAAAADPNYDIKQARVQRLGLIAMVAIALVGVAYIVYLAS